MKRLLGLLFLCAFGVSWSWAQTSTTTTLSVSPDPSSGTIDAGAVVTLTATVSPAVAGTISFCDAIDVSQCKGVAILGHAQVSTSGTAIFRYTPGIGNHNYFALYAGTTSAAASSSSAVAVPIGGGTFNSFSFTGTPGNYTFTANYWTFADLTGQNLTFVDTTNHVTLGQAPLTVASGYPDYLIEYGPTVTTGPGYAGSSNTQNQAIVAGDFDNDGATEFVAEDQSTSRLTLYKQANSSSPWTAPWTYNLPSGCQGFVLGGPVDLNHDGNLDFVAGCWNNGYSSTIYVFLGNGDGTFQSPILVTNGSGDPRPISIIFGDFNNDGNMDMAVNNREGENISVFFGNGNGTFQAPSVYPRPISSVDAGTLVAADFNHDGWLDLAYTTSNNHYVYVLRNDGTGHFSLAATIPVAIPGGYASPLAAADFDGDGNVDLAFSTGTNAYVYRGDGAFGFSQVFTITGATSIVGLAAADFDGDGVVDLVYLDNRNSGQPIGTIVVYKGDGSGGFSFLKSMGPWGEYASGMVSAGFSNVGTPQFLVGANGLTSAAQPNFVWFVYPETLWDFNATLSNIMVPGSGDQQVVATYNGTDSNAVTVQGTQLATSVVLAATPSPAAYESPVALRAILSISNPSSLNIPGTDNEQVIFYNNGTEIGTGSLVSGVATCQNCPLFSVGSYTNLTAGYGGDSYLLSSTSAPASLVVNKGTPGQNGAAAVAGSSTPNPSIYLQSVTLNATLPKSATGTVTFEESGTTICSGTASNGTASCSTASLLVGTHSITAIYGGDANWNGASSAAWDQVVSKGTPGQNGAAVVAGASTPNPSAYTQSVSLNATLPTSATGTVTFEENGTTICSGAVANGSASCLTASLLVGTHSITAVYGGDANWNGASSAAWDQVVSKGTPGQNGAVAVTGTSTPNPSAYTQSVSLNATLPSSATGTVTFEENGTTICSGAALNGAASCSIASLSAGTHSITAVYGGNANWNGATSASWDQVVNKGTPGQNGSVAVVGNSTPNPSIYMQSINLSATLPANATGSVSFEEDGTTICSGPASNGAAACSTTSLSVGTHSITAVYSGDANWNEVSSAAWSQVVGKATFGENGVPTLTLAVDLDPSSVGQRVTFTATVPMPPEVPVAPTGTVTFVDATNGNEVLGIGTVSGGLTSIQVSTLAAGSHNIVAMYNGDASYNKVGSNTVLQTVNRLVDTPVLDVSSNPQGGSPTTITVTLPPDAGGTVTITEDGNPIAGCTLLPVVNGKATCTPTLPVGTGTISGTTSGDPIYLPAPLPPVTVSVADFAIKASPATQMMPPGSSIEFSVRLTSLLSTFGNNVTLSASGLPEGATVVFDPPSVVPGASGATSTMTISVPQQSASMKPLPSGFATKAPFAVAALLLPLTVFRKGRKHIRLLVLLLMGFSGMGLISGCGMGGYFSKSEKSYTITVTGTSGSLVHSTTVTLTVE